MLKLRILDRPADFSLSGAEHDPGVYIWRDPAGRPCAYGHTTGDHHWMHWPRLASYQFDDHGGEVLAYPAGSPASTIITDTFQRMVLPLALQRRGLEALHASAVVIGGRVVVFCAVSGTGKSTLAYALSRLGGHRQWSDDAVVFDARDEIVTAVALPFDARLLPETARRLSGSRLSAFDSRPEHGSRLSAFGSRLESESGDGGEISATATAPTGVSGQPPLGAVCVLGRISEGDSGSDVSVVPLAGSRALAAVLEHAHCFNLTDLARKKAMLEHYLTLVERVPHYEVRFRAGFERLPGVVEELTRRFVVLGGS